ncbi:hypothetical protein SDC9_144409 [bioreactor metagenome]|uniref:Uncharacterized protein n=1 Tax=bioreactor metagenome TaxID=1076179 RepID=A0A645E6P9_9ZZZZ
MPKHLVETMLELGDELGVEVFIMSPSSKKFVLEARDSKHFKRDREWSKSKNPFTY